MLAIGFLSSSALCLIMDVPETNYLVNDKPLSFKHISVSPSVLLTTTFTTSAM